MSLTSLKTSWFWIVGLMLPVFSFAEEAAHAVAAPSGSWSSPLAVGIGIAIAVFGAATAQGRIAASFMEGVSRNPGGSKVMFVPLIIGLAFVETLVLFAFALIFPLLGKF